MAITRSLGLGLTGVPAAAVNELLSGGLLLLLLLVPFVPFSLLLFLC